VSATSPFVGTGLGGGFGGEGNEGTREREERGLHHFFTVARTQEPCTFSLCTQEWGKVCNPDQSDARKPDKKSILEFFGGYFPTRRYLEGRRWQKETRLTERMRLRVSCVAGDRRFPSHDAFAPNSPP
jgi:hypothetical protein